MLSCSLLGHLPPHRQQPAGRENVLLALFGENLTIVFLKELKKLRAERFTIRTTQKCSVEQV